MTSSTCIEKSNPTHKKRKKGTPTKKMQRRAKRRDRALEKVIKREQASRAPAIRKMGFRREAKLVLSQCDSQTVKRISPRALDALQEAAETYLIERLGDALQIAKRHDRQTPNDVDLQLICKLKPLS